MTPTPSRFLFALGLLWSATEAAAASPIVVESRDAPARDAVLFVGADLFVHHADGLVPVSSIEGRAVKLDTPEHERVEIRKTSGLQLRRATKVSAIDVKIEEWRTERQFSPQRNPTRQQMYDQLSLQGYAQDRAEEAQLSLKGSATPLDPQNPSNDETAVQVAPDVAFGQLSNVLNLDTLAAQTAPRSPTDLDASEFDALALSFEISSARALHDVNAVVVVRVSTEGQIHDVSFVQDIGKVDPKPRKLTITRAGMPLGFEVLETRIHLFAHGEEVPTNRSEKRYALTADEAREYLRLLHLDRNRGATVAAAPAWSLAPAALFALADAQSVDFPVEVDLDATGRVVSIRDSALIVPEHVRELVRQLVFVPALQNGLPVASTLRVNPAAFFER